MKIFTYAGTYSPELCARFPNFTFLFGDNLLGVGKGGQACIRDCPNAYGIPTKRQPNATPSAYFDGATPADIVDDYIANIPGDKVVVPIVSSGEISLGLGLAQLDQRAPQVYERICELIDIGNAGSFEYVIAKADMLASLVARRAALGRKPGKKTRELELEWFLGAAQVLTNLNHPLGASFRMLAFLSTTRDVEEMLRG